ncbi:SGNH/GDSL hydrolase family protein [Leeuwenhoekiella sp. NPDC079379]|uniref:SGNH/GDSL hydrolase family protein n=1 Tax=Leeuwenhoekiella sp. NPDC079379 TaxID=3364122 RepID=UPI0037CBFD08
MKRIKITLFVLILFFNCNLGFTQNSEEAKTTVTQLKYLALGDSYTAGTSVCYKCAFPVQLSYALNENKKRDVKLTRYAEPGWRTDNLIATLKKNNIASDFNFTTLLIGVNNIYQKKSFNQFKTEFELLLDFAINHSKGNAQRVIVISIPDYAYTPFGLKEKKTKRISSKIDVYNKFTKKIAADRGALFLDIVDITRKGLNSPHLVAEDDLHPSSAAHTQFVARLIPIIEKLLK